ncbi:MAG: nuclear transport factor 2 family protein [Microbacterium sp.]
MSVHESIETRLAALESRVRELSDVLDIQEIVTYISPAADSGHPEEFASRWLPDAVYHAGVRDFVGSDIPQVITAGRHPGYMAAGCAHFQSPPHIEVSGDTATAVNYTILVIRDEDSGQWTLRRLSASRWKLRRVDDRWQIQDRTVAPLDGSAAARDLLAEAL